MKKFLITILLFVILVVVLAFGLDVLITKGLHRYTDYTTEVWNDLRDTAQNPDVIVLGSCAAHYDCNPDVIDSVLGCDSYVFSMSNLTFPSHNFIWNMYKQYHNRLPKVIVMILDYGDMNYREVKTSGENIQFLSLTDDIIARQFLTTLGGYNWWEINVPCYRYYGHHELIKHGLINGMSLHGYEGCRQHYKGFIPLDVPYSFHSEWFDEENIVSVDADVVAMFDTFLADCKHNGIQVVLAVSPLGNELEDIIVNIDDIYGLYKQLAQKYDCPYVSFTQNEFSRDTANFESPNHLNKAAADVFSADLANYIKQLNIY